MVKDDLVDARVSSRQCKQAVTALTSHAVQVAQKMEETELLPGKEENVWLVLTVKKTFPEKKLKPFKIPIKHPLVDPRTTPICLITKDPQREYKDLLELHNIKFISRVVGIKKLKGKFKPFEARRQLLKENGLFLADERVVPLLPGLLGKKFFEAKKQPIPVCLTRKDLKGELERAISSTYFHQNQGTCSSVKIGTIMQTPSQILDNLKAALPAVVQRVQGGWENVQSFNIKTNSSVSLPIWSCNLGQGEDARWTDASAVDAGGAEEGGSGSGRESESENEEDTSKTVSKGKKRAAIDGDAVTSHKKVKKDSLSSKETQPSTGSSKKVVSEITPKAPAKPRKKEQSLTKPAQEIQEVIPAPSASEEGPTRRSPTKQYSSAAKKKSAASPVKDVAPSTGDLTGTAKTISAPVTPTTSVTREELKLKRAALGGMEKKKEKVAKGKIGKAGAKESIVGRAVKARV